MAIDAPATGCGGAACAPCAFAHAQPLCIGGACAMGPCANGFADCDRDPSNGCEVDLRRDAGRCGSCLTACTFTSPLCEDGACTPRCKAVKLLESGARAATKVGVAIDGDFTLELWLRWHGDFEASAAGAVFATTEALPTDGLVLGCSTEAGGQCTVRIVGGPGTVAPEVLIVAVPTGGWHHLAFQRAGGELTAFVDGAPGPSVPSGTKLTATSGVALGRTSQVPPRLAAPVSIGPVRLSTIARYAGSFTPRRYLPSDASTALSWLSSGAFDGSTLNDESGHSLDAAVGAPGLMTLDPLSPCAP
ncbi:MAG: hypothetical protein IT374_27735 [Polyangiaceae bacterium]|nr:hypothetical protein [Polyangiaceae bacterium]